MVANAKERTQALHIQGHFSVTLGFESSYKRGKVHNTGHKINSHIEHSTLRTVGSKDNVIGKAFKIS